MSDDAPKTLVIVDRGGDSYPHNWSTGLIGTVCKEPCFLGYSCICFPCSNVSLRKDALDGDLSRYRCFQHHFIPCCGRCIPGQRICPCCCLILEAHCCPVLSALATRHTIQDKLHVKTSCAEKCCLRILCICECALCCCDKDSCFCEVAHALGHCCLCVIMPCMNAQGHHELKIANPKGQLNDALLSK